MNTMIGLWLFFRAMRWLAWISFFGTAFYCMAFRPMTQFGHLQLQFEVGLIALGNACIFLGFMELMMREKAGIPRPVFGQLIPPVSPLHGQVASHR
jgi:hypothetical protein